MSESKHKEKIITARKDWTCHSCDNIIKKGDKYLYGEGRAPRYDEIDNQIGIQYYKYRICLSCKTKADKEIEI